MAAVGAVTTWCLRRRAGRTSAKSSCKSSFERVLPYMSATAARGGSGALPSPLLAEYPRAAMFPLTDTPAQGALAACRTAKLLMFQDSKAPLPVCDDQVARKWLSRYLQRVKLVLRLA